MTQTSHIKGLAEAAKPRLTPIAAVRLELAAWSERQPRRVRQAARCLDGWLDVTRNAAAVGMIGATEVDVIACTARAVERLRAAVTGTQHHQVS